MAHMQHPEYKFEPIPGHDFRKEGDLSNPGRLPVVLYTWSADDPHVGDDGEETQKLSNRDGSPLQKSTVGLDPLLSLKSLNSC